MTVRAPADLSMLGRILFAGAAFALCAYPAAAQSARDLYNIPSQDTGDALNAFAHQSGLRILFPYEAVAGKRSPPVKGTMTEQAALDRLLAGTGLTVISRSGDVLTLGRAAAAPEPIQVEEVVVTAQKRVERIQDVPMSMTALSGDRLTQTHADTLRDLVDSVPGLQLISNSPISNELVIRGLSVGGGVNSSVATYVDEAPYTSEGPFAYAASIAPDFDTYDLARVEVLRGPQGTLYGANALAGLLKYVTNAPDPSHYSASFLTGFNSVEHGGDGWEVHGMVNLPLGDTAALRIVGYDSYFPGFIDDPSRGETDINDVKRYGGRAALLWRPSQDLSFQLSANYQRLDAGDSNTEDLVAATLKPLYGELVQQRVIAQPETVINEVYNGTVNWNVGFANLVSSTSYSKADPRSVTDLSSSYGPVLSRIFGGDLGAQLIVTEPVHSFTQELRLSSPTDQKLEWVVGFYYDDESANEHEPLFPVDLATGQILTNFTPSLGSFHITSTYREYAGFGDLTYHFTPAFEVSLGGRYSSNKQSYHQMSDGALSAPTDFVTDSQQDAFTYSVDAKYRFSPQTMVYGRIATGFVPGGPNDLIPGSPLPSSFRSSTTTNSELGVKGSADGGKLTYDFDVFDIEWKDIQLQAEINNLFTITNGGTARSRGVEGGLNYAPVPGLTLGLNGAYIDAHLTEATPESFGGVAGDRLPLSPRLSGTASVAYERPLWSGVSGFSGIEWHYNGSRMSEFEFGLPRQKLPSYSMVNLRLGLKFQAYTLTAYVKNVGDVRAINSVSPELLGGVTALSAAVITPRTVGMTFAANF